MPKAAAKARSTTKRFPMQTIIYTAAALVSLIGLTEATYLTVMHLTGQTAVCGDSATCSKVLGSGYAQIGPIPVAALGALSYFGVFSFATFAAFGYVRVQKLLALNVWAMFAVTLWLLYVQAFLLHAFCRYCLFSAAMVFLLAGLVVSRPTSD